MDLPHPDRKNAEPGDSTSVARPSRAHTPDQFSPPSRSAAPSWTLVARLIRPHGRHGEIVADILTDFPERFHSRARLHLMPPERIGTPVREILLENFWFQRSRIVFKFGGVDSINDAESLRGYGVAIPSAQRAPLEPGTVYAGDLIGCTIYDLNSAAAIGEIIDLDRGSSSTDLLVVRRAGALRSSAEILIPFVSDYLVHIDLENRRLDMRLPEGLLEINAPITDEEKREQQRTGN
jgi:16S rRNA processing protein RimM